MYKRYKYRLYPNKTQQAELAKWFGCARFVWNRGVELNEALSRNPVRTSEGKELRIFNNIELDKFLPRLKHEHPWLKEIYSSCLQQVNRDVWLAFKSYERDKVGRPKFKAKFTRDTIRFPMRLVISDKGQRNARVHLPKLGKMKLRYSRDLPKHTSATITCTRDGQYYISFVVKAKASRLECETKNQEVIGVDLGVKDLAITSAGEKFPALKNHNANLIKNIKRLERYKEIVKYKTVGSRSHKASIYTIEMLSRRINNQRLDYLHKVARQLSAYGHVTFEQLDTMQLIKKNRGNKGLQNAIQYAGWRLLVDFTAYRLKDNGGDFTLVNPRNTSKLCNSCGWLNPNMKLGIREWICSQCGVTHDRDINAAINIKRQGIGIIQNSPFGTG